MGLGRVAAKVCPVEVAPGCHGHTPQDKWQSCLAQALYHCDHDATTGTVDGFGRWVGLIIQDTAETLDSDRGEPVTIPAGTYAVVTEDDRGFTSFDTYDTAEEAQDAFDAWDTAYGIYEAEADAREYAIIHGTGRIGR